MAQKEKGVLEIVREIYKMLKDFFSFSPLVKLENWIMENIINSLDKLTGFLVDVMLKSPLFFLNTNTFEMIYYSTIAKFSVMMSLPVGAFVFLKMLAQKTPSNQIKESMIRIFLMPVFIGLSPVVLKKLLKLVTDISHTLYNTSVINQNLQIGGGLDRAVLIIASIVYIFLLGKLTLYYSFRNFGIIFLLMISPFLYLFWCIPGRFDKINVWLEEITSLFVVQIIHIIQFLILLGLIKVSSGLEGVLLQIGALLFMSRTPEWLQKYIGGNVSVPSNIEIKKYVDTVRNPAKSLYNKTKKIFKGGTN